MHFDLEDVASVRAWVATCPGAHAPQLAALLALPLWGRWRELGAALESECANFGGGFANSSAPVPHETEELTP